MYKITEYIKMSYENSVSKGWYENPIPELERIMLMISEVSEATEEVRDFKEDFYEVDGKPEGQAVELADLCIRIFDYAGYRQLNLCKYIETQFFVSFQNIEYIRDINDEVKQLNNLKCYEELEKIETDLEFHASISISLAGAAKSLIAKNDKEFIYLSEALIKVFYYSSKKGWDFENILCKKHAYNLNRPYKHGGKKC